MNTHSNFKRMPDLYIQCELVCKEGDTTWKQVVWLPTEHSSVKQGGTVTLKEDPKVWTIARMFTTLNRKDLDKKWKVGGLE